MLKLNRQTEESIKALENGLARAKDRGEPENIVQAIQERLTKSKESFVEVEVDERIQPAYELVADHMDVSDKLVEDVRAAVDALPGDLAMESARESVEEVKKLTGEFETIVEKQQKNIKYWRHDKEVTLGDSLEGFFFGSEWQTGSPWQNNLRTGSPANRFSVSGRSGFDVCGASGGERGLVCESICAESRSGIHQARYRIHPGDSLCGAGAFWRSCLGEFAQGLESSAFIFLDSRFSNYRATQCFAGFTPAGVYGGSHDFHPH